MIAPADRALDDAALKAIIHDPKVEIYVLYAAGASAAYPRPEVEDDGPVGEAKIIHAATVPFMPPRWRKCPSTRRVPARSADLSEYQFTDRPAWERLKSPLAGGSRAEPSDP